MNSCEKTRQTFHDALASDGAALPPEASAHLAGCPDCRAEWTEIQAFEAELRLHAQHGTAPMPAHLHGRIMEALAAEPAHRARRRPVLVPIALAAAAVAIFLLPLALVQRPAAPPAPGPIAVTIPTIRLGPELLGAETLLADSGRPYASTANGFYALAASAGRLVESSPSETPRARVE